MVAGADHDPSGQHYRSDTNPAQLTSRHEIRHSLPVFARAAYGTIGSNLPAIMRAIVACGWFGIQAWIGGEALNTFFGAVIPGWKGLLGGPNRRAHDNGVALVPAFLGPEHLYHLPRYGLAAES